jgi:DNA-binding IclR family transcriptional regulator
MMRAFARPGARASLLLSVGKALPCAASDGDLAKALQRQAMGRVTEKTTVSRTALAQPDARAPFRHR